MNITIYTIICQYPIDNCEIYDYFIPRVIELSNNCRKSVFIDNLALREDLRELFCVCCFADYVKVPQIYVSFGHIRKHASKHLRDT